MMYRAAYFCTKCDSELLWNDVMDSKGVCPYCGHVSDGTICDHVKRAVPCPDFVRIRPGMVIVRKDEELPPTPPALWPALAILRICDWLKGRR